MSNEIRNINNGKTGNCPTPGALTPTDAQNVAVFTGDVYDDYFEENQAELNKRFAQGGGGGDFELMFNKTIVNHNYSVVEAMYDNYVNLVSQPVTPGYAYSVTIKSWVWNKVYLKIDNELYVDPYQIDDDNNVIFILRANYNVLSIDIKLKSDYDFNQNAINVCIIRLGALDTAVNNAMYISPNIQSKYITSAVVTPSNIGRFTITNNSLYCSPDSILKVSVYYLDDSNTLVDSKLNIELETAKHTTINYEIDNNSFIQVPLLTDSDYDVYSNIIRVQATTEKRGSVGVLLVIRNATVQELMSYMFKKLQQL
ncbi:MAG: hypothetical protein MJ209_00090 [archaeon]|nr:hypothetical protein [archaeon]